MELDPPVVVCAGHLCLDIFPDLKRLNAAEFESLFAPGRLVEVGPAAFSTGGAVSNTGLALHKLGVRTALSARIGDDPFGGIVRQLLSGHGEHLPDGIREHRDSPTSYTIVLNPPGQDRIFLHCPGANDLFGPEDVPLDLVRPAKVFHFGYPPLMARMYADEGAELEATLRMVRETETAISVDMSYPDPSSASGRAPWPAILRRVLPHVDFFLPSLDEIRAMLGPGYALAGPREIAAVLLDMGAAVVVIKMGQDGVCYASGSADRLARVRGVRLSDPDAWAGRSGESPCFSVEVAGTTGSGDATIAGFLAAFVRGLGLEACIEMALAVGACSVEKADAVSGIRSWEATRARIAAGWPRRS